MSTADSTGSVSSRILNGLQKKFPPAETFRVIDCFTRFIQGKDFDVVLGDGKSEHNRQVANCYVEGLASKPFYDIYSGQFEWGGCHGQVRVRAAVVKKTPASSSSKGKRDELKADKKSKAARPAKGFHRGV
eukprot:gene30343-39572_t